MFFKFKKGESGEKSEYEKICLLFRYSFQLFRKLSIHPFSLSLFAGEPFPLPYPCPALRRFDRCRRRGDFANTEKKPALKKIRRNAKGKTPSPPRPFIRREQNKVFPTRPRQRGLTHEPFRSASSYYENEFLFPQLFPCPRLRGRNCFPLPLKNRKAKGASLLANRGSRLLPLQPLGD